MTQDKITSLEAEKKALAERVVVSIKGDFTSSNIGPNAFVGFLGKTEDGKAELAKKEMVKVFDINKTMKAGTK